MVEVAAGPSDSATHEKVSWVPALPVLPHITGWMPDVHLLLNPASHGAESAQVKLLPPGSLRPPLLAPGLRRHFSTR